MKAIGTLTGPSRTRVFETDVDSALGTTTEIFEHFDTGGACPAVPGEKLSIVIEGRAGVLREFYSVKRHQTGSRIVFRFDYQTYETYERTR